MLAGAVSGTLRHRRAKGLGVLGQPGGYDYTPTWATYAHNSGAKVAAE